MAITIVATAGSATANSLVLESEVIAYMAAHLNASSWTTTSGTDCTETEKAALIEATRELSNLSWAGQRADATQALAWPRDYALDVDDPDGNWYDDDEIPQRVKDACCELAFQFVKAGATDIAALDSLVGITEKTIDVLTTRYDNHQRPQGLERYPSVMRFIRPLLSDQAAGVIRHTVWG